MRSINRRQSDRQTERTREGEKRKKNQKKMSMGFRIDERTTELVLEGGDKKGTIKEESGYSGKRKTSKQQNSNGVPSCKKKKSMVNKQAGSGIGDTKQWVPKKRMHEPGPAFSFQTKMCAKNRFSPLEGHILLYDINKTQMPDREKKKKGLAFPLCCASFVWSSARAGRSVGVCG